MRRREREESRVRGIGVAGGIAFACLVALSCSAADSQAGSPVTRSAPNCTGPQVVRADIRPITSGHRRDASEASRRLDLLKHAHCPLAKRLLDDVHTERRILDEG